MKKLTLLTAAALSCCMFSTAAAQVQILRATGQVTGPLTTQAAAPRFVSDQTQRSERASASGDRQRELSAEGTEQIPNPFDYFAQEQSPSFPQAVSAESAASANSANSANSAPRSLPEEHSRIEAPPRSPVTAQQPSGDSLPAALPAGRDPQQQRSIVDTIVDQAAVGNVPQWINAPMYRSAPQTPNPVADWLLREECVAGLWGGYQQQRAAECAHMWAHLSGHCGHHSACGAATGVCNACDSPRVRNRYLEAPAADAGDCATCNGF